MTTSTKSRDPLGEIIRRTKNQVVLLILGYAIIISAIGVYDIERLKQLAWLFGAIFVLGGIIFILNEWISTRKSNPEVAVLSEKIKKELSDFLKLHVQDLQKQSMLLVEQLKMLENYSKVDVIFDMEFLKEKSSLMKSGEEVDAVWIADYGEIDEYFRKERDDLLAKKVNKIKRLINSNTVPSNSLDAHNKYLANLTNNGYNFEYTDVEEFELLLRKYRDEKSSVIKVKALLTILDIRKNTPVFGLYMDPDREPKLDHVVAAFQKWFDREWKKATEGKIKMIVTPSQIWERIASIYDTNVTMTDNKILQDYTRMEKQFLADVVEEQTTNVTVIEIGSGTGRVLIDLANRSQISGKIDYLIGTDNASSMIDISKNKLMKEPKYIQNKINFFHIEGEEITDFFRNGTMDISALKQRYGNTKETTNIQVEAYSKSKKIVCILLNTLGIMRPSIRESIINNMVRCAGKGGLVIISVFNANSFDKYAGKIYRELKDMVGNFKEPHAFNSTKHEFRSETGYFSNWFEEDKISQLMSKAGCHNMVTKEIGDIALFMIGKT